jgi:hypothetical protein
MSVAPLATGSRFESQDCRCGICCGTGGGMWLTPHNPNIPYRSGLDQIHCALCWERPGLGAWTVVHG